MDFLRNEIFLITITFGIYHISKVIYKKTGWTLLNPILLTISAIIIVLKLLGIDYQTYSEGSKYIEFWLKPAVVALGVPLYTQLQDIKKQAVPILLSQIAGCIVGLFSVIFIAQVLGASKDVILSLASKSVTTPIAMETTRVIGGIPALTSAVVVCTGILGGILGFKVLQLGKVKSPIAQGLSMGTASHAVGASAAMEVSNKYGAYASLGLTINGILTAIITPYLIELLNIN